MRKRRSSVSIIPLLASVACSGGESGSSVVERRDSATIAIVEIGAGLRAEAPEWSVSVEPAVSIGSADGAPEYQLFRVTQGLRMPDGAIVVADNGSATIRFFDPSGIFIRLVGGRGEGPGEYQQIGLLGRYGADSLVVWDGALRRMTVLDAQGSYVRTLVPQGFGDRFVYFQHSFGDGSVLGRIDAGLSPDQMPEGIFEATTTYVRLHATGQIDTVGEFFGNQAFVTPDHSLTNMPFGRSGVVAAAASGFFFSTNDRYELRHYTSTGDLIGILRFPEESRPLTTTEIEEFVQADLERFDDPAALRKRMAFWEAVPYPEALPAFAELRVDAVGNVWAADYRLTPAEPFRWTIITPEGQLRGRITTSSRLRILDIGADYVLGVERDELDIERVVVYSLVSI